VKPLVGLSTVKFARAPGVEVGLVEGPDDGIDEGAAAHGEEVGLNDDPLFVEAERRIVAPVRP